MQGEQRVLRRHLTRSRRNIALGNCDRCLVDVVDATAATVGGGPVAPVPPEDDVAEWFDEVDPAMVVDKSADCMAGAPDTVFYRGDRIVMRPTTTMTDAAVRTAVNTALNGIYGTSTATTWATTVERISSRCRYRVRRSGRCSRCRSSRGPMGRRIHVVELARALRHEPGIESAPDYGLSTATPYSFFWPKGYPTTDHDLTPAAPNVTLAGLPIGTGIKVEVYDVGLAPRAPGVSAERRTLPRLDNEVIDAEQRPDSRLSGRRATVWRFDGVIGNTRAGRTRRGGTRLGPQQSRHRRVGRAPHGDSLRNLSRLQWPSVIVNSFGSYGLRLQHQRSRVSQLEPVGLSAVVEVDGSVRPGPARRVLIVASAGNEDTSRETYPAAFDSVLAVGALDTTVDSDGSPWSAKARTGPKAEFSNYGDWVDAWTSGVSLPMNHVSGRGVREGPVADDVRARRSSTARRSRPRPSRP